MLLQTNSYIVPPEKRSEHTHLMRRFRQTLLRLGCDHFEVYEQAGSNWSGADSSGRFVQILRFVDRQHQLAVQAAERTDPVAQKVIADFCDLINFSYQQQEALFAVGFFNSALPIVPKRGDKGEVVSTVEQEVIDDPEAELTAAESLPDTGFDHSPMDEFAAEETALPEPDESLPHPSQDSLHAIEPASPEAGHPPEAFDEEFPAQGEMATDRITPVGESHMRLVQDEPIEEELLESSLESSEAVEPATSFHSVEPEVVEEIEELEPEDEELSPTEFESEAHSGFEPELEAEHLANGNLQPASHEESRFAPKAEMLPTSELLLQSELDPEQDLQAEAPAGGLLSSSVDEPLIDEPLINEPLINEPLVHEPVVREPLSEHEPLGELEPEDDLMEDLSIQAEPELLESTDEVPPLPSLPAEPPRHFMSLAHTELTEDDEQRAHSFIQGELVDDLENEHLNALSDPQEDVEELTGHEVQPSPKHDGHNTTSSW